ncbi:MAG: hypothetical protein HZA50_16665 [Planctomycetes bacterium]|nr:hypothetical protein [Planctomycetota bacterium]
MPKERSSEISIQRINLTCKTSDLDAVASAMKHAGAEIVGNCPPFLAHIYIMYRGRSVRF